MSRHTKLLTTVTLIAGLTTAIATGHVDGLFLPASALAAGVPLTPSGAIISTLSFITSILIVAMNTFTWMLFMLLDIVLNPTWIFDTSNGSLTNMLREIWQLCRDLVNLSLAFTLIGGAIMMIITSKSEMIMQKLPKFVLAMVLVNFSWFIPRAVFDLSQIVTYTVYQIPSLLNADGCVLPPDGVRPARPCEIAINYAFFDQTEFINPRTGELMNQTTGAVVSTGWKCLLRPLVCVQFAPVGSPEARQNTQMHTNVLNGLIVNHARLQQLVRLSDPRPIAVGPAPGGALDQVASSLMFLVKMIVVLLLHVAIFFPLLAMVAAFFMRIPILWVTMAFMPLVALSYTLPESWLGESNPKKLLWDEFLKVVFLPAKVAVPFTIGFIMVNAGASSAPPGILDNALPISLFSGVRSIWQVLWMVIAMFIIWKYSFDALKGGGDVVNKFTDKIQGYGQGAFQLAGKTVTNTPFIPLPQGRKASLSDFGYALNPNTGIGNYRIGKGGQTPYQSLTERIDSRMRGGGGDAARASNVLSAIKDLRQNNVVEHDNIRNSINVVINAGSTDALRDRNLRQALDVLKAQGGTKVDNVNERDAVEGIIKAFNIQNADAKDRLQKALGRLPGGGAAPLKTP